MTVLKPSYTEDFSNYKSFPSMCFGNAFRSNNGRLLFTSCGGGTLSNLHLFEFNGYNFRAVSGSLGKIKEKTSFKGSEDGENFLGLVGQPSKPLNFLAYNLNTDEIKRIPPPVGEVIIRTTQHNYPDPSVFVTKSEAYLKKYKYVGDTFRETNRIAFANKALQLQDDTLNVVIYYDDKVVWVANPRFNRLRRLLWSSNSYSDIVLEDYADLNLTKQQTTFLLSRISVYELACGTFLQWKDRDKKRIKIGEVDTARNTLTLLDWPPSTNLVAARINQDEASNLVFVFSDPQYRHTAFLQDTSGTIYNYTEFVAPLTGNGVLQLVASDFRQQVFVCNTQGFLLQTVKSAESIKTLPFNRSIRKMVDFGAGRILVATQNGNLSVLNTLNGDVVPLDQRFDKIAPFSLPKDKAGFFWVARDNHFVKFNEAAEIVQTWPIDLPFHRLFTLVGGDKIAYLTKDNRLAIYDLSLNRSTILRDNGEDLRIKGFVHDLKVSTTGDLLFASNQGFGWVNLADQTVELHGTSSLFSDTRFLCIHEAKDGKLWLGTPLNGLQIFDPLTGSIKTVNDKQGLANNTVASITEDAAGDRWLGTYNGVSLVNDQGELITNLYETDGLAHHESNRFAGFHSASGIIYVGTVQGISQINPKKVKTGLKRKEALKVFLTAAAYPFGRDSMVQLSEGLGQIQDFILPANNRRLQLNLATSNYINPNENKYAYRIVGLSNEWIDLGNQPSLMLSNLPAGNYHLEIRGGDGNGNWSKSPLVFGLKVQEFFYRKPWFYLATLLLIVGLVASWINSLRLQVRRATHQIRADKAVIESQATKLQELDHAKNHFFTNISHEFRTPLTIISGMASQITNNPKKWTEKGALLIKRNSDQLLRMVNQIMDLRKLESSRETAQYIQGDVVEFIKFLVESYQNYASGNSITLHFLKEKSSLQMDYDPDKLMKIISNLLSNAVKFTPEGGNIYLQL
ncbi:MAG: triple tyrosine motif-containing protein, partial [Bacteroidota bacterium]